MVTNVLSELFSQEKEMAFDALFSLLPINFSWIDRDGLILGCNQYLLDAIELPSLSYAIGKHTRDIASEEAWINTKKVIDTGKTSAFEEIHTSQTGKSVYFHSMKSPIKSYDGNILGVVNIAIDVTDRKLMEIQLDKEKKAAIASDNAKTEFLRNMRHDLRTPFCGIIGMSEILHVNETDPEKREHLQDIITSSSCMLKHLNSILEYLNVESGNTPISHKEFDLHAILEEVYNTLIPAAKNKRLAFTLVVEDDLVHFLVGDPLRLQAIMVNIISNAIKFTDEGYIKIHINGVFKPTTQKYILEIYVKDTGIGIPENKKEVIFERFSRLSPSYSGVYEGEGLGLSLVKEYLKDIGGQYDITTKQGHGTIFKCYIPYELPLLP